MVKVLSLSTLLFYLYFMKRFYTVVFSLCFLSSAFSQDTLTVMTYNILNYPNINPTRYNDLKVIADHVKPDIFICSELTSNNGATMILDNSLNTGSINYYSRATFMDGPDTDNMLFYNSNKVHLQSQNQITTSLRDISHYKVYTCENVDTVWYDIFSVHLKASSGASNANDRLVESTVLTNYLATLPSNTNIIVGGDFNFYGVSPSVEPAWNQLINVGQLKDPINMMGEWHANSFFKSIHTQSTRSNTNPGCCGGSTGGMDDRFDFLLINENLRSGSEGAKYITGTYKAIGQDGNHYNQALVEGSANASVPAAVNTALFNMSDHLPVVMKVYTCDITIGLEENSPAQDLRVNFMSSDQIRIQANFINAEDITFELMDVKGSLITNSTLHSVSGSNEWMLPVSDLSSGVYVVRLSSPSGFVTKKIIY